MNQLYPSETERVVLGSLILGEGTGLELVEGIISKDDFSASGHSLLFEWIQKQVSSNEPVSIHVLIEKEGEQQCEDRYGSIQYLHSLGDHAVIDSKLPAYAKVIYDCSVLRSLMTSVEDIKNKIVGGTESVEEIRAYAERMVLENKNGRAVGAIMSAETVINEAEISFNGMCKGDSAISEFVPTGMPSFDRHYLGWPRGLPTYIGGRTKMGKTAFMLAAAAKGAIAGVPQGIISVEMGSKQLAYRLASYFGGISLREALHGNVEYQDMFRWGLGEVSRLPIHVDDVSRNIDMVASSIRQMKRVHGCEVIWIDYIQLLTGYGRKQDERTRLDSIADAVRQIAKEERVAIVALAQFNRMLDTRIVDGKKGLPNPSDFRGSDKFLQDAGLAFGIYRPFYYDPPKKIASNDSYTDDELSTMFQPVQLISLAAREAARKDVELVLQTAWGRVYDTEEPIPEWWSGVWPPKWT